MLTFLLIDNWFTKDELKDVHIELDFFQTQKTKLKPIETGVLISKNERTGESLEYRTDRY